MKSWMKVLAGAALALSLVSGGASASAAEQQTAGVTSAFEYVAKLQIGGRFGLTYFDEQFQIVSGDNVVGVGTEPGTNGTNVSYLFGKQAGIAVVSYTDFASNQRYERQIEVVPFDGTLQNVYLKVGQQYGGGIIDQYYRIETSGYSALVGRKNISVGGSRYVTYIQGYRPGVELVSYKDYTTNQRVFFNLYVTP